MEPQVGTTFIPISKEDDDVLKAEEKKMIMKEKEKEKEKEDSNSGNNHKENDGGFFANKCWNVKNKSKHAQLHNIYIYIYIILLHLKVNQKPL